MGAADRQHPTCQPNRLVVVGARTWKHSIWLCTEDGKLSSLLAMDGRILWDYHVHPQAGNAQPNFLDNTLDVKCESVLSRCDYLLLHCLHVALQPRPW